MCRLLGIIANRGVDLQFSLAEGPRNLRELSAYNVDGWGLGWYERGQPKVVKEPVAAHKSARFGRLSATAFSRIFVGHVRKATRGVKSEQNCHPFSWGPWLFAHNGSIDREGLLPFLDALHRHAVQGETDSEVYFHWLLQNIESCGGEEDGIQMALRTLRQFEHAGLNFILTDGGRLYAYREAVRSPGYYTLYYLIRDPRSPGPESLQSREVNALLRSKSLRNEKAVLICSEKLTDEGWAEIPLRHLLIVSGDLAPRLVEVM